MLSIMTKEKHFNGYKITSSGEVFKPDGTQVKGSRIGKNGHVIMTLSGRTIYLARLVYCLFNGLDYDAFCGRVRYYDGNYSNCALSNIFIVSKPERKESTPRQKVDAWYIRELFIGGLAPDEISQMTGVHDYRVKLICAGFETVEIGEFAAMKKIIANI